jgi:hypothetical protein
LTLFLVPYRFEWVAEDTVLTEHLSQNRETVMRNEKEQEHFLAENAKKSSNE